jgi:tRNA pseudouridine38-40 synthase
VQRLALGVSYRGGAYKGWQSQPCGVTVQDVLERALAKFAGQPLRTVCAGRTDAGVHAVNQVVHIDTTRDRPAFAWLRGTNRHLPADVALQWCQVVSPEFHARYCAIRRRYAFFLLESAQRPALESGVCGWVFRPLDSERLRSAAQVLIGEHDFSAFRSAECQAASPVKVMYDIAVRQHGAYWRFDFEANAFLHHMVRNIMGCLLAVGNGSRSVQWLQEVLVAKDRRLAAPTFAPDGLYFLGPHYDARWTIPEHTPAMHWLL